MTNISKDDILRLERLSLVELMQLHGHAVVRKTKNNEKIFFLCPFHDDKDPSFVVLQDSADNGELWKCFGCGRSGRGAISLQCALTGKDRQTQFLDECKELAKLFNITIGGVDYSGAYHRAVEADKPSKEIQYSYRDMTDEDLASLGCIVEQVYEREKLASGERVWKAVMDKQGKPVKRYSWGKDFESNTKACNFDIKSVEEMFSVRAVESYISQAKYNQTKGQDVSWKISGTTSYPIFDFHYEDNEGWWSKKYEPRCKPDKDGRSFKFTWWYEDGDTRDEFLGSMLYGDTDFMQAWNDGVFADRYGGHPVSIDIEPLEEEGLGVNDSKNGTMAKRFKRLILCSGPRDGINTYYMSDCHVCWPHSEAVKLSYETINRLAGMADEVFVMFDIDETGIARANEIAVSCLKFKVVRLPMDMKNMISSRTKKPCKDASEYFSEYRKYISDQTIRSHFEGLLKTALSLRFWEKRAGQRNTGSGSRVPVTKFEIVTTNMNEFLPAVGLWRYSDKMGTSKFVTIKNNQVQIVNESKNGVETTAIELLANFVTTHHSYYHHKLLEAINSSTKISSRTLSLIPKIKLDFNSYGEDFDYFFFRNGAVRITDKGWKMEPYTALDYAVNKDTVIDAYWKPATNGNGTTASNGMFEIEHNTAYIEAATKKHEEELAVMTDPIAIEKKKSDFKKHVTLWRYKLKWITPVNECPPFVQYLWNCSRFFWEQEEKGVEMTPYQKQFCEIHFINKIGCIGYLLSRFRTSRRQYIVELTDYISSENSRDGRNGKSTIGHLLLPMVRKVCNISGNEFKSRRDQIGLNFRSYKQTIDQMVYVDDLHRSVEFDNFINLTQSISVKTLYENEYNVPFEESPKIMISHNTQFLNSNKGGTYKGRLYTMYWSNYYHEASDDGAIDLRTPETEFGDMTDMSDSHAQMVREMLAYALSFYLRENKTQAEKVRIEAPLESMDEIEQARKTLRDDVLWEWATCWFMKEHHFKRPMARSTMCLDYMKYRNDRLTPDKYIRLNKASLQKELTPFQQKLEQWCLLMKRIKHIVYNPISVFKDAPGFDSKPNSNGTCMMRKDAWVYQMDDMHDEFDFDKPKVLMNDRCYYFYYEKDIPKSVEDIMAASAVDMDEG